MQQRDILVEHLGIALIADHIQQVVIHSLEGDASNSRMRSGPSCNASTSLSMGASIVTVGRAAAANRLGGCQNPASPRSGGLFLPLRGASLAVLEYTDERLIARHSHRG